MEDWLTQKAKPGRTDLYAGRLGIGAAYCVSPDAIEAAPSKAFQLEDNITNAAKGPMTEKELEWLRRIGDYEYGKSRITI